MVVRMLCGWQTLASSKVAMNTSYAIGILRGNQVRYLASHAAFVLVFRKVIYQHVEVKLDSVIRRSARWYNSLHTKLFRGIFDSYS